MNNSSRYSYKDVAQNYDEEVKAYSSYAHETIFGMLYEFISAKESLLDIGIGTGLASKNFAKAGLLVSGLDNSKEMLGACQTRGFTDSLTEHDIAHIPYPYRSNIFNHIICCGVFHFFSNLSDIVSEVKRLLSHNGTFSFTIAPADTELNYIKVETDWGVPIFEHSIQYITQLLRAHDMKLLKEQRILVKGADKAQFNMEFSVIVCKYNSMKKTCRMEIEPEVAGVFDSYPAEIKGKLLVLRNLILETAAQIEIVGEIEETLKWGEPSYLTPKSKSGSTIRIAWKKEKKDQYSIFFKCTADLVSAMKERYPDKFTFGGNRSIDFKFNDNVPEKDLKQCIALALTYHRNKKLDPPARWEMIEKII